MSPRIPLLLAALCALSATDAFAQSCSIAKSCSLSPPPGVPNCPSGSGKFLGRQQPGGPICEYTVNQAVPILLACETVSTSAGGMYCEGWAQETSTPKQFLTYTWTVRVGWVTTNYNTGTDPYLPIACSPGESVRVKMTIKNGTYQTSVTQTYGCGNLTQ